MTNLYYILILLCFCLVSCKNETKDTEQVYDAYHRLANIGWKSKKINHYINTINYTATEVPIAYYILKNQGSSDLKKVDSIYNVHKRERVLEIEFHHDEEKDLLLSEFTNRNYTEAVKYMAFTIQKDFTVVTSSQDTISCAGVQFERNFKVAPFKRALLYFGNINPDDQIQLIYNDELFGNGIIKFKFKETPIKL
ncbi:MAG: hypothetical protein HRT69_12010 [Flavobacteriaceae bacterium]|nr:hypothetical protein [Flavobacteriaceae bacterium]